MADLADTPAVSENTHSPRAFSGSSSQSSDDGRYASELHSVRISARQRTFYLDLKESGQGKFFKLSEKSRGGRKVTIMFDVEDLPKFIDAFTEMKEKV